MKTVTTNAVKGIFCAGVLFAGVGCETIDTKALLGSLTGSSGQSIKMPSIEDGLREALNVGIQKATAQLSTAGGYSKNKQLKIPVPAQLKGVESTLKTLGLGGITEKFQSKMGEAAEQAAALAGPVFTDAIKEMKFDDVKRVFNGGDTAATDYLKKMTSTKLKKIYLPIVRTKMEEVGAVTVYNDMIKRYNQLPLVKKVNFNVEEYVAGEALNGMFAVLAQEEQKIRKDPAARTTEILKKVFATTQAQ